MQISEVEVVGKEEQMTAKDALLLWAQKVTQGYVTVKCLSLVTSHFLLYRFGESVADLGEGTRGPTPLIFWAKTEAHSWAEVPRYLVSQREVSQQFNTVPPTYMYM